MANGRIWQYCSGDQIIPLGGGTAYFSTIGLLSATHYINSFYIAAGYDYPVRTWNGLSNTIGNGGGEDATTHPAHLFKYRALYTEAWQNRLWIANTSESTDGGVTWTAYPNRIRFTSIGYPDEWDIEDNAATDATYVDIYDKDGDEIVGLSSIGDDLLIFKRNSIHKLVYTGGEVFVEAVAIDAKSIGNAGFTVARTPQGILFLNQEGLQITDGNSVQQLESSGKIDGILSARRGSLNLKISEIKNACAVSDETRQEYHIIIPAIIGSAPNPMQYILTWNWEYDTWKIRDAGTIYPMSVIGLFSDSGEPATSTEGTKRLMIGRHNITLVQESESWLIGSSDYQNCYHITPWLDFGTPGEYKEVIAVQPMWSGTIANTITLSYQTRDEWSNFSSWNDITSDAFVTNERINQPVIPVRAIGTKFRFRFNDTTSGNNWKVYSMKVFYNERSLR